MNPRIRMYLRMVGQSFAQRVSRILIAVLSITVGAATLSGLGLLAYSVPNQLKQELRSYGANLVVLPTGADTLSEADIAEADETIGAAVLARAAHKYSNLVYNNQSLSALGVSLSDAMAVRPYWSIDGQTPTGDEILVGENIADRYRFKVGEQLDLRGSTRGESDGKQFTVSGILRTGGPEDDLVVLPIEALQELSSEETGYSLIEYSAAGSTAELSELAQRVIAASPKLDAEVVQRVSQTESGIAATLQTLIWLVSIIICGLTVIAVSATLGAIVNERAKEFGLKKALGAQPHHILIELIGESTLLGLLGGGLGIAAGIWLAEFVSHRAFAVDLQFNALAVPITVFAALLITLGATLLPARRISTIEPHVVLSGE